MGRGGIAWQVEAENGVAEEVERLGGVSVARERGVWRSISIEEERDQLGLGLR